MTIEDYVHRLGRTGRAGAKGEAYTFFTDDENKMARKLIEVLKQTNQEIPFELEQRARMFRGNRKGNRGRWGGGNRNFGNRFGGNNRGFGGNRFGNNNFGGGNRGYRGGGFGRGRGFGGQRNYMPA